MSELSHLLESIRPIVQAPDKERIAFLRVDRWIDYPRAAAALHTLEDLLSTPQRARMPCLLIHGDSGMGKTMLIEKFRRAHKSVYNRQQGLEQIEIVVMQMPASPSERRFYSRLLEALGAPHRANERLAVLESSALHLMKRLQPRMIVVDEVHHLLAGSAREQRAALNLLKFLANEQRCVMVALGTRDALVAMATDAQVASRFTPLALPNWQESDEFRRFLLAFERVLPLRERSNLGDRPMVQAILAGSNGITGRVAELLTEAARKAILQHKERISVALIESLLTPADELQPA
jgi:Bacterial TniB protein